MSQLTRVIALLYRMHSDDIKVLANTLLEARKQAWRTALAEMARAHGCNKVPNDPRREDLAHLRELSQQDAQSIAETWNRDVKRQIERLFTQNPRGNRQYYFSSLEAWAAQRAVWKDAQIAMQTEQTTRQYAQSRFREMNDLVGRSRYVLVGPVPVCRVCARHFARGLVDEQYIRRNPAPVHIACPHEWSAVNKPKLNCAEVWVG